VRTLAKPEPRAKVKARADRAEAKARKACRLVVIEREGGQCAHCRAFVSDDLPEWHRQRAHVHEVVPRSRGGSATDPYNCLLLCQECHGRAHGIPARSDEWTS
jgi:5-methylcytosine-specific restriction endonuclease McrA